MTSLLGAIVRLTESAAKGAGKMALSGAKSAAVKAFQRVGTYSNTRLRGPSANTKPATKAPDAIRPSAIKGPSAAALVDPVAGIDQVISAVNASSDKIARTIDEVNTELQKFLYKRRPSGGTKKSQSGEEEDEEQKKNPNKPKIRPTKPKVRPKAKPKTRFRRGPKNALSKLRYRNPRNALTRLGSKAPRNALTKIGPAASLGASTARPTKLPSAKGVPGGSMLGKIGTALGMYFEFADEMNTTGNMSRGAAAAAGTGAGMMLGGKAGAVAGGALGTLILPGLGTTIGAIAGGLLGGWGGGELGATAGRKGYDAATGFTPGSKGAVSIAGESLVKINDLEYAFSNVIFESRELVFEYNKIERGRQSGAVGFGGGGGSVISVGPDGTIGRVSSGDAGGALFGPRSGGGGSGGGDPSGVIPSGPRDATKNERTRTDNHVDNHVERASSIKKGDYPENTERLKHASGNLTGLDPKLMHMMKDASKDLPSGYHAEIISGRDPRRFGTTNHPGGIAADIKIYDADGKLVPYDRGGPGMAIYEKFHQSMVERGKIAYPDEKFIWGGTWISQAAGHGDPMHMQRVDRSVPGSSTTSGAYDENKGAPRHKFAPYLMTDDERKSYKERIKKKALEEAAAAKEKDKPAADKADPKPDAEKLRATEFSSQSKKTSMPPPAELDFGGDYATSMGWYKKSDAIEDRRKDHPLWGYVSKAGSIFNLTQLPENLLSALDTSRKLTPEEEAHLTKIGLNWNDEKLSQLIKEDAKLQIETEQKYGKGYKGLSPHLDAIDMVKDWEKTTHPPMSDAEIAKRVPVPSHLIEPRPEEPARKTVDEQNVTGPPQVNTLKEKQRHSGLELNDRDDNNIYQTYTEYSNLSKVV